MLLALTHHLLQGKIGPPSAPRQTLPTKDSASLAPIVVEINPRWRRMEGNGLSENGKGQRGRGRGKGKGKGVKGKGEGAYLRELDK